MTNTKTPRRDFVEERKAFGDALMKLCQEHGMAIIAHVSKFNEETNENEDTKYMTIAHNVNLYDIASHVDRLTKDYPQVAGLCLAKVMMEENGIELPTVQETQSREAGGNVVNFSDFFRK